MLNGETAVHPLDNVIWKALSMRQAEFADSYDQAAVFLPEVASLGAMLEPTERGYASLSRLLSSGCTITLALETPYQPRPGWNLSICAPGLQMVCEDAMARPSRPRSDPAIVELGAADVSDMMELTGRTKPGPFDKRTYELGRYLGIRRDGKLVAMAGERLKVPGYTEVSAVCTHPEHTGQGYARILMMEIMQRILSHRETPFLHVREANVRAVELYRRLGFVVRQRLRMTILGKTANE